MVAPMPPIPPLPPDRGRQGDPLQRHDCTPATAARLVALARLRPGQAVLEPGSGQGEITIRLLEAGCTVHAIELDSVRLADLDRRCADARAAGRLHLHAGDATRLAPRLAAGWAVVGNPPFQVTSALLRHWLLAWPGPPPTSIHLLLQREAAERLVGVPGQQSRWSVLLRLAGRPQVAGRLPRSATRPPSRVDLALFSWQAGAGDAARLRRVDRLLERAFAGPRSMAEALRGCATGPIIRRQAAEHGWHPDDHPRRLAPEAWAGLADFLAGLGRL